MPREEIVKYEKNLRLSHKIADTVTQFVGSWNFIIIQSIIFLIWISINVIGFIERWDPYPFVFLNLVLALQTVYTSPLIMMSQNRQSEKDKARDDADYDADLKTSKRVELLQIEIVSIQKALDEMKVLLIEQKIGNK